MTGKLSAYGRKRHFGKTPEPKPVVKQRHGRAPIFVIQKHDARRLHYDFRLEMDGVLKSWAVPKGPSTDLRDKRLAVPTEDHPMAYARFEGRIPDGQYGAGPVIVWDRGTYRLVAKHHRQIEVELAGRKLKGGYALTKFRDRAWLLVKMKDRWARRGSITRTKPNSVVSRKTLEGLERAYRRNHPRTDA